MTWPDVLPLAGVRALELSSSIAGAYAGRLLRDLGADVTLVGGGPQLAGRDELAAYLRHGKREVPGEVENLLALTASGDVHLAVVELEDAVAADLMPLLPGIPVAVLTPWGLAGPWSGTGRPWSEFTLQVESGSLSVRGDMDSEPVMTGSSESLWVAGAMAAGALVAASQGRADRIIDIALLEVTAYATNLFQGVAAAVAGTPVDEPLVRRRLRPSVEPASDGFVGFNLASSRHQADFLELIGRPEWVEDPQMSSLVGRLDRLEEWDDAVRSWTSRHTVAEILRRASALRLPCAPVHDGASVVMDDHVAQRAFFSELDGSHGADRWLAPRPPMLFDGVRPSRRTIPDGPVAGPPPPVADEPFDGLRVLDLGTWWVGAYVGSALGSFGADVIKIESVSHLDGARALGAPVGDPHWWEHGYFHLGANFNKQSVTLDFTDPGGRDLLVALIRGADVLLENHAPHVLESAGLGWEAVHELNPRLVMLRMPAFGLTGPKRGMVGFAQTVEQFSGLCVRTGYADRSPMNPQGPADPMGGASSFLAVASAILLARTTGRGMLVESPLVESALVMGSEQVMRFSATGERLLRQGNRCSGAYVQGVFPARGDDRWVGVSALTPQHWSALMSLLGDDAWPPACAEVGPCDTRWPADEVEAVLSAWLRTQEEEVAVDRLSTAGVPAAVRRDYRFTHTHPHLAARGAFEVVEIDGLGPIPLPTLPFQRLGRPDWLTLPPPRLGQDNHRVLVEELGLTAAEIRILQDRGVVGTAPTVMGA